MRLFVFFASVALLGIGLETAATGDDFVRPIAVAEAHRTLDAALLSALREPALAPRAALAIGRTKRFAGAAALRARASSADPQTRAMCAYALGLLDDAGSLGVLRRLARTDRNSAVRYAAVDAIGRVVRATGAPDAALARDLIAVARGDSDAVVRAHAAAQFDAFAPRTQAPGSRDLRALPPRAYALALETIVRRDRDAAVRWHAAWALFRGFAANADGTYLRAAAHDRDELVRVETARALGRRSKDARAKALASTLLDDPSWRVQYEAREAVRRLGGMSPTEHLVAVPAGIHLPVLPDASPAAAAAVPSPGVAPQPRPSAAPDPATYPLPPLPVLRDATALDGPGPGPHPRVAIATTKGDVVVRLYPEWAPSTVANFLALARSGYFDGNRWFRIVPDFVVQTGDPTDTGDGDAGYAIPAEENPIEQRTGIVAMGLNYAGSRAIRDSAGTQFYVTLSPQLHLDRDFSVFGEIESGTDVLANLIESDWMIRVRQIDDR